MASESKPADINKLPSPTLESMDGLDQSGHQDGSPSLSDPAELSTTKTGRTFDDYDRRLAKKILPSEGTVNVDRFSNATIHQAKNAVNLV